MKNNCLFNLPISFSINFETYVKNLMKRSPAKTKQFYKLPFTIIETSIIHYNDQYSNEVYCR